MTADDTKKERFESYPRPAQAEEYKDKPEFIDEQPNDFHGKSVSNVPDTNAEKHNNDPEKMRE